MALNVECGTFNSQAFTGNQTISLPSNFDPIALILFAVPNSGDGVNNVDANFTFGMATYRGGAARARYSTYYSDDNNAASVVAAGMDSTAIISYYSAGATPTVDVVATFVSFTTGSTSDFTLNWTNIPSSVIRVGYMVLGGSDITDAYVTSVDLNSGVATQDVTVVAGFGQPDLVIAGCGKAGAIAAFGDAAVSSLTMIGVAYDDTHAYSSMLNEEDAAGTMLMAGRNSPNFLYGVVPTTQAVDFEGDLSAVGSWPTDGFQITWADQPAATQAMHFLALKGSFTKSIGTLDSPTSTGDTDFNHGSTPKGALFFSCLGPGTAETLNTTGSLLGSIVVGAYDGTNEVSMGAGNSGGSTSSGTLTSSYNTKAMHFAGTNISLTPTLYAAADGAISGNNVRLSWTTVDTSSHRLGVLSLGDAPVSDASLNMDLFDRRTPRRRTLQRI